MQLFVSNTGSTEQTLFEETRAERRDSNRDRLAFSPKRLGYVFHFDAFFPFLSSSNILPRMHNYRYERYLHSSYAMKRSSKSPRSDDPKRFKERSSVETRRPSNTATKRKENVVEGRAKKKKKQKVPEDTDVRLSGSLDLSSTNMEETFQLTFFFHTTTGCSWCSCHCQN